MDRIIATIPLFTLKHKIMNINTFSDSRYGEIYPSERMKASTKIKSNVLHTISKTLIPTYKKYAKNVEMTWNDPSTRLKPSELSKPVIDIVADDYPMIIEFNNMKDTTSNYSSTVDIDQPIFQPSPKILVFEGYEPFALHEKRIFFRNNDSVSPIVCYSSHCIAI